MPRKVFNSIPEKLTGDDFVKVTDYLYLFHWDESVCLYRCPHTKRFALIPYAMYNVVYSNAWAARNNAETYGIKAWYQDKASAVRQNHAYLYDCMLKGKPYALLKMQGDGTKVSKSKKDPALV